MKNRFLSAFLIVSIVLLSGCGGGGSSSGDTGDPTGLYSATINSNGTAIGAVIGDDAGNQMVSFMSTPGADTVGSLIADFADGSEATATMQNGVPTRVTDGTTTATFSNWNGATVDVTITSGGETETVTGVNFAEYAAQSVEKGWPQFFGATWTTLTVAFCPVSIALSAVSIGAGLPAAIVGCTLAGTNLYRLLNGQSTLVEEVATYVSAPASCAAVAAGNSTTAQQEQCASDTLTTLPAIAVYIDENGEIVTPGDDDGGGGSGFAGSCTLNGNCINYTGTDTSAADIQAGCEAGGGIYSTGACSTSGVLGYCTVGAGTSSEYRVVFYDNLYPSTEAAEATCDAMNGTFTAQ